MRIRDFFDERTIMDEQERKDLTYILRTILLVVLFIIPVTILMRFFDDEALTPADIVLFSLLVIYGYAYLLIIRNKFFSASLVFAVSGWIAMTIISGRSAGIKDVGVIGYILLIYLSTLLTGYRFAIVITLMSVISVWIMAFLQDSGILIPYKDPPLQYARDFTVFLILVLVSIILFERSFRNSYLRIQNELSERIAAERKLSANEKILIEKNEELRIAKLKAEESDRLKTAFLENISHEIRTPMNDIVGLSELLRSQGITKYQRFEYIEKMLGCSGELASLIDDLIDLSKIESRTIDINMSAFRASDILNVANVIYRKRAEGKGLIFNMHNNLGDIYVRSDQEKIIKAISKIIDNAVKFTGAGAIDIFASLAVSELVVVVRDTGIGLTENEAETIFDRFLQSDAGLKKKSAGAGLGLAICKGLIDILGGKIMVRSTPGSGSEFEARIPVELL